MSVLVPSDGSADTILDLMKDLDDELAEYVAFIPELENADRDDIVEKIKNAIEIETKIRDILETIEDDTDWSFENVEEINNLLEELADLLDEINQDQSRPETTPTVSPLPVKSEVTMTPVSPTPVPDTDSGNGNGKLVCKIFFICLIILLLLLLILIYLTIKKIKQRIEDRVNDDEENEENEYDLNASEDDTSTKRFPDETQVPEESEEESEEGSEEETSE